MRTRVAFAIAAVLFSIAPVAAAPEGPAICFYGIPPLEKLKSYRTVILQPALVTAADVATLRGYGCRVLGYLSVGEDDHLRRGNGRGPGGYASWYIDENTGPGFTTPGADAKPDSNANWGSYYVDPSNAAWRDVLKDQIRHLRDDLGMDGIFVDTALIPRDVFTTRQEARMHRGMTGVLKSLKAWSNGGYVLVNNGEEATVGIESKIDGLMIETTVRSGPNGWDEVRFLSGRLDPRRGPAFLVTALVYLPPDVTTAQACEALTRFSLAGAVYRDDEPGRALTSLPLATCP